MTLKKKNIIESQGLEVVYLDDFGGDINQVPINAVVGMKFCFVLFCFFVFFYFLFYFLFYLFYLF